MAVTNYQIETNTRRCAVTGAELCPGDKVHTALFDEGGRFVRRDYSDKAWHGVPDGAFSFWSGKVPPTDTTGRPRIDDDLLMECFERLENQNDADRIRFRYVVALLLMRRKRLKFESAGSENGEDVLALRCPRTRTLYTVVNPRMTADDMTTVQDEVFRALGWE